MVKTILLTVAALLATGIVAVLTLASLKPDTFTVRRSIAINAPPERIFPLVADFRAWSAWSPWEKKDPDQQRSFSGPESGVGARYAWDGDKNVGQGSMMITEATAPTRIGIDLDFVRPFEAHNKVVFALQPEGNGTNVTSTQVTWTMTGPVPFFAKIIHVVMNMDRMIGGDFEAGLRAMKAKAER